MKISNILFAFAGSMGSGYLATKVMEKVSMKLFELGPQKDQEKEEEVRPGPPFKIAAKKTLKNLGFDISNIGNIDIKKVYTIICDSTFK